MNFIGRRKAKIIVHEQTKFKIHNWKTEKKSVMKTKPNTYVRFNRFTRTNCSTSLALILSRAVSGAFSMTGI
jgi:hypothetical protein